MANQRILSLEDLYQRFVKGGIIGDWIFFI